MLEIFLAVGGAQQLHVAVELTFRDEHRAEALDRHVGQREQLVEDDAVVLQQMRLIGRLQGLLRWRQRRPLRVENKIQQEIVSRRAVTERVQALQALDAGGERALAALLVDVLFEIAGQ